jgi:DNA-binding MarR family transcriptional regulator
MRANDRRKRGSQSRGKQALRLWLRLLACEGMAEQRLRSRLREEFGITLPQFDVLSELERAAGALTMSELSQGMMVSNGNITGVVDRLVRDGFVKRTPSPSDRRVQYIELTHEGTARFSKIARRHERWVADLFAGLTARELEHLIGQLRKAKESIVTSIAGGVSR